MPLSYVPLWVKSHYSFLEGSCAPRALLQAAGAHGLTAMALSDRHGVYGMVQAHQAARAIGMQLIVGAELWLQPGATEGIAGAVPDAAALAGPRLDVATPPGAWPDPAEEALRQAVWPWWPEACCPLVALVTSSRGYGALCQLITRAQSRAPKGQAWLDLADFAEPWPDLLWLCPRADVLRALHPRLAPRLLYALCTRHLVEGEQVLGARLLQAAKETGRPVVAASEVLYSTRARRPLQDVMQCIRAGCTLQSAGRRLRGNSEHVLLSPAAMRARFADMPEALYATCTVAERCHFSLDALDYRYPEDDIGSGEDSRLAALTWAGAGRRYGGAVPEAVARQLREELQLIEELGYGGYFLTMHTIVNFCHEQHILCQGRGSAANSVVCYCLGITAIDPVRMQLLFARFLSRERAEPPDIDLDIEHGRREEVIRFVYARYGTRHAAMVANVVRYRRRSALRDVGKVLGLPPADIDALAGRGHPQDAAPQPLDVRHTTLDADAPSVRQLATLSAMLVGTPRHLSIHPGGFLLGREPVDALVPIEDARRPGRTVIQWDKDDIEALGFFKVDLLALGALTAIHHAFDMLETHCGKTLSMDQIPAQDPATYAMLQQADTVGVFQIESRAQMSMLPRLRPATFYDLVVQVAIVRPGPIQGDMVHPYLRRRAGEEEASYPHPALETTLRRTLGVPIFQEQVMKIAILVAGYSPGEADQLRRDMAAWRTPGRIEAHRERLIGGMQARGIAPAFVEAVFRQILGFGEYGFPESHAASFALIAYATAWLKCHHPAIFLCAMLQAQPMGFYSVSTLVRDAQRHGVVVRPVDVRHSRWRSSLEPLPDGRLGVRMGLRQVKGLGERAAERLIAAAAHCGDLHHLQRQVGLALPQALALARAGAFASFGLSRRAALWQLRALHSEAEPLLEQTRLGEDADKHSAHAGRATHHIGSADVITSERGAAKGPWPALTPGEQVTWDQRASAHSTRGHPMQQLRAHLAADVVSAQRLLAIAEGARVHYVGMIICRQRPGSAKGITFLTLEDESGFANVIIWPRLYAAQAHWLAHAPLVGVRGKLQRTGRVQHLRAEALYLPTWPADLPALASRDFH